MPEVTATPISLKCKVCGGDIVNNYLAGVCSCANCGNKWSCEDLIPEYSKYQRIISGINKANTILSGATTVAGTNEAKILFKTSANECGKINDAVSADLLRVCNEGQEESLRYGQYLRGKDYFQRGSYDNAIMELSKITGYKDSSSLIEQAKVKIAEERKKNIPWAIVFSLILPAIFAIILKEKAGVHLAIVIPIFLMCSAGLGYVLYRGGVLSLIIKVISFLCAAPLVNYLILAYVFHLAVVPSAIIAIAIPIVLIAIFAVLTEQNNK